MEWLVKGKQSGFFFLDCSVLSHGQSPPRAQAAGPMVPLSVPAILRRARAMITIGAGAVRVTTLTQPDIRGSVPQGSTGMRDVAMRDVVDGVE